MDGALLIHRLHFAFTITFHYLFPQLTMGLALLIVVSNVLAGGNPQGDEFALVCPPQLLLQVDLSGGTGGSAPQANRQKENDEDSDHTWHHTLL